MADQPLAVIDIGSNSGRMIVVRSQTGEHIEVLAEARVPLRLARDVAESGQFGEEAINRTLDALRDFRDLAAAAGVVHTIAVGTAAVREAKNGIELLRRIGEEIGIHADVITGDREAAFAFLGAVHSLPVEDGVLLDIGGGSLELSRFSARTLKRSWTLPLGALLLSHRFLTGDPPSRGERRRLADHVIEALEAAGVRPLSSDERLIGTGGTIRNLAKMDRREHSYPIARLHGYVLPRERAEELADLLASRPATKRASLSGLNADRADSIIGGAIAAYTVLGALGAEEMTVSGKGLREGIAMEALGDGVPEPQRVRAASIAALAGRFSAWDPERGARRGEIASTIFAAIASKDSDEAGEMLGHAATILDAGGALDVYNRHDHAAAAVLSGDLAGFLHPQLAFVAAILRRADKEKAGLKPFKALLRGYDPTSITRAAAALAIADEVDRRLTPGATVRVRVSSSSISVGGPLRPGRWSELLSDRIRVVAGRTIAIKTKEEEP